MINTFVPSTYRFIIPQSLLKMVTKLYFLFEQIVNGAIPFPRRWERNRAAVFLDQAALPASAVTSFFAPSSRSTTICTGSIISTCGIRVIISSVKGVP